MAKRPKSDRTSRQLPGSRREPPAPTRQRGDEDPGARDATQSARLTGTVKRVLLDKGFGFIREDVSGREYFFHYEGTAEGTRESLEADYEEGTRVEFDGRNGPKGWRAEAVRRV